jgi:plastocyanin
MNDQPSAPSARRPPVPGDRLPAPARHLLTDAARRPSLPAGSRRNAAHARPGTAQHRPGTGGHRRGVAGVALLVSLLALAACGGSSGTTSAPAGATSGSAGSGATSAQTVTINNFAFSPKTLDVAVGTTVTWVNKDVAVHDVKFTNSSIPLSPLLMSNSSKDSWSHTFTKAGTYAYICGIHPYMTGTVVVGS